MTMTTLQAAMEDFVVLTAGRCWGGRGGWSWEMRSPDDREKNKKKIFLILYYVDNSSVIHTYNNCDFNPNISKKILTHGA